VGNQIARVAQRTTSRKDIPPHERNDRWLTPMPIIEAITLGVGLPMFDLDPCGAPGHETARRVLTLENGDDGLRKNLWQDVSGQIIPRVWMNPPYGPEMRAWVDKFVRLYERGKITGTMLVPVATGTKLWQDVLSQKASAILYWRHRINFQSRDDTTGAGMVSVQASALLAFGEPDATALWDSVTRELLPGTVTRYID
jgi:hypothetical protein